MYQVLSTVADINKFIHERISEECSEKFMKGHGIKAKPIIKGYGHRVAPMRFEKKMADNRDGQYMLSWTGQVILDSYKRTGLTVDDKDVMCL